MRRLHISPRPKPNAAIETLENRLYRSADLTGVFSGNTPGELVSANRNRVAIEVENTGDATAKGLVTVDIYAATGMAPQDGSLLLTSATRHVKLKPGADRPIQFRFAAPTGLDDGSYSLLAQIDASAIPNAIATNDIVVAPSPVQVNRPFVDLTAQDVQGPIKPISINDDVVMGGPASVMFGNHGNEIAKGTLAVDYYLSPDSDLDSKAFLAGENPAKAIALKAGGNEKFKAILDPPASTPAGNYFLFAVLVPGGGIVQTNTGDEVGEAVRQVGVVRTDHTVPPQTGVEEIFYDGSTVDCTPGDTGVEAPCPPAGSVPLDNPGPPSTAPATCPTTGPTTNYDPPGDSDSDQQQTPADSSDNSDTPTTSNSSDTSNTSDSAPVNPDQAPPVDASVPPADDVQPDPAGSDGSDDQSPPTDDGQQNVPSDGSSEDSGSSDDSWQESDDGSSDGGDDGQSAPVDNSGGDDGSDVGDSWD